MTDAPKMTDYSVVFTTVNSEEEARKLARNLIDSHLAACVSIIPNVTSIYNWKDEAQEEKEFLLVIKTAAGKTGNLQSHFASNHPYEVPEFLVLRVEEGSSAYLRWMGDWLEK
jgi:periplasmic divalent cation tolerance protein